MTVGFSCKQLVDKGHQFDLSRWCARPDVRVMHDIAGEHGLAFLDQYLSKLLLLGDMCYGISR
jgi:hypothetical protein